MSWTDTNWKLVDGVDESLPYSTQLTNLLDSMDTTYSPKVCWVPFQLTGDTTNTLIKYRGTEIVDTIDNSDIKFVFHKDGYENFELPKTVSNNIDIPGAAKGLSNLTNVTIPLSVKYIDHYAFWNTGLTEVTIAADCVYQRTSFPINCTINNY